MSGIIAWLLLKCNVHQLSVIASIPYGTDPKTIATSTQHTAAHLKGARLDALHNFWWHVYDFTPKEGNWRCVYTYMYM
jgi:hypothetical protein